jgi:predicted acyltransferase
MEQQAFSVLLRGSNCGGAGKLFALGLLIQGGVSSEGHFPVWDLSRLRTFGVLQRISLCFLLASLLVLYVPESRLPKLEVGLFSLLQCL